MLKTLSTADLSKWSSDFSSNQQLPSVTNSALIPLSDLEDFMATIKGQQADSVRIYFLRFRLDHPPTEPVRLENGQWAEGCNWMEAGEGFTQATVALVPAKNFKHDENFIFSADDVVVDDNQLTVLFPGVTGEGTGLNPPPAINTMTAGKG